MDAHRVLQTAEAAHTKDANRHSSLMSTCFCLSAYFDLYKEDWIEAFIDL